MYNLSRSQKKAIYIANANELNRIISWNWMTLISYIVVSVRLIAIVQFQFLVSCTVIRIVKYLGTRMNRNGTEFR